MKNFEKYKTVKERVDAFSRFCKNCECHECIIKEHACGELAECAFVWLDLEAETETQMDCPYCDRPILGTRGTATTVRFVCDCGYSSCECHTVDEAISAHNRICRAVKAAKESEVK